MKIHLFYHSLISDWNHGNAHFLRGMVREWKHRGHEVEVWEEENNWSLSNLLQTRGEQALHDFREKFEGWKTNFYNPATVNLRQVLADADLVIVHEWNHPDIVSGIGNLKKLLNYKLLFHDTHHRSVTAPEDMEKYDLRNYDGVLAFGGVVRDIYLRNKWAKRAWTWHEAADTALFRPLNSKPEGDLVWVGNWGDGERKEELREYLIEPVARLGLKATIYGVRYPAKALDMLAEAGIAYGGYLPGHKVPEVFSNYKMTAHIPRRPYVQNLPGIPTIRPFEALACGIPLVCSPWQDSENLFREGDYLRAGNGAEMEDHLRRLRDDENLRQTLARHGLQTLQERHTCAHRADELEQICDELDHHKKPLKANT